MRKFGFVIAMTAMTVGGALGAQEQSPDDKGPPPKVVPPPQIRIPPPATIEVAPRQPLYPRDPILVRRDSIIGQTDYPAASWVADERGRTEYAITVSAEGKPLACKVTQSSGHKRLDATTCDLMMQRAEFRPAYAAQDEPVEGTYNGSHNWYKREPGFDTVVLEFQYDITKDGSVENCSIRRVEGELPDNMRRDVDRALESEDGCIRGPMREGVPYRDANGNPVAKRVTFLLDVKAADIADGE